MPNSIQNNRLFVRIPKVDCPLHMNGEAEFVLVKKGCLTAMVDREARKIHAKECTVIFPYQLHAFQLSENTEAHVLMFPQSAVKEFCATYMQQIPNQTVFPLPEHCLSYIYSMLPDAENSDNPIFIQSVFAPLAAQFLKSTSFSAVPGEKNSFLQQIIDYLYLHSDEPLQIKTLSAAFGVRPAVLNQLFDENLHIKPFAFLNNLRIEKACIYLSRKDLNITEIAYACGYGSLRTFNRAFQKVVGCTPTEFRRGAINAKAF